MCDGLQVLKAFSMEGKRAVNDISVKDALDIALLVRLGRMDAAGLWLDLGLGAHPWNMLAHALNKGMPSPEKHSNAGGILPCHHTIQKTCLPPLYPTA